MGQLVSAVIDQQLLVADGVKHTDTIKPMHFICYSKSGPFVSGKHYQLSASVAISSFAFKRNRLYVWVV